MASPGPSSHSPPHNFKHKPNSGEHGRDKIWFISGVSLDFPPWKNNIILSKAILLNPVHVKRLGDPSAQTLISTGHRKRRIYVNLVVLFRLIIRCQHLAFDHDQFWLFIRRCWGLPASPHQIEDLVDIYAKRRLVYIRSPRIQRRHVDLLTELIDTWNDRDPEPPQSRWPPQRVIADEWAFIKDEWDAFVRSDFSDFSSLIDDTNPPVLGTFARHRDSDTTHAPASFKIKNAAQRSAEPDRGRELFPERAARRASISNPSPTAPKGPSKPITAPGPFEEAVDELIGLQGQNPQKRKEAPEAADATPTKRQCVPEPAPSSPRSRPSPPYRPSPTEEDSLTDAQVPERKPSVDECLPALPKPSMPPSPLNTPTEPTRAAEQPKQAPFSPGQPGRHTREVTPSRLDTTPFKQDATESQENLPEAPPGDKDKAEDGHLVNLSNADVIIPFEARLNRQDERLAAVGELAKAIEEMAKAAEEHSKVVRDQAKAVEEQVRAAESQARAAGVQARSAEVQARAAEDQARAAEDQARLLAESGDLSRDIQKAHNDLTVFTAATCTDALAKLDALTGELSALSEQVAACRRDAEEMQHHQEQQVTEQKYQLEAMSAGLHSRIKGLQKDLRNSINDSQARQADTLSTHAQLKRGLHSATRALEAITNQQNIQAEAHLQHVEAASAHMKSMATRMLSIESQRQNREENQKGVETRLSKLESSLGEAGASSLPIAEFDERLKKAENGVTTNSQLINNCRTLVEASKTRLDQQYSSLDNRIRLLEQRFNHRVVEQDRSSKEQAERMDRLEAELLHFKKMARPNHG
ncbi:hypothetical protein CPLU01_09380 [Colletotrichum plurivorum]|uniref:Uncharacterized protein n=1 Tax=Colletotrichum plurivorum TaxID=2175906 RepID=A0A8H6K8W7_9PEZI|nr:hypothetical protein CPLU01_09380 [Colletotrichum plurivorum]